MTSPIRLMTTRAPMYSLSRMLSTSNGRQTATDEYELTPKGRMGSMAMAKADTQPITTSTMAGRISRRLFYIRGEVEEVEEGREGGEGGEEQEKEWLLNTHY